MKTFAVTYAYAPETLDTRDEVRATHRAWLQDLADAGTVLSAGKYADNTGALLIFVTADEDELRALLAEDPYAKAGCVADVSVKEWTPAIGAFAG
ncbi:YciI family protein [Haematomicrobium sanguinis]|uniref:YciI family protein n=1 Tax=Haematomicrobium sanguinis TaxID=479106 RepID=UPI000479E489|nr:muconolactone Delta-isomerase family protein [Haematomicrobium sanguinis]